MATSLKFQRDNNNFTRLCKLLISGGTQVLRDIFDTKHPPHDLRNHLDDPTIEPILRNLRTRRVLFQDQWDKLYGPSSSSVTSSSFDITLLCLLLRNICHLPNPARGWNDEPSPTSINIEDDIVRMKIFRNRLYGHISEPALSDADFTKYWNDIETVLVRLGADKAAIDDLKRQPLDPDAEQHFIQCLQEWERNEKTAMEELREFRKTADEQHQETREKLDELLVRTPLPSESTRAIDHELYSQKLKTSTQQKTEMQPKGRAGSKSLFENVKTDQIFTTLTIHEGPKHLKQHGTKKRVQTKTRKEIKKCSDLFAADQTSEDNPKSILVDGRAGIGKTLFTQKLVRDWSKDCLFDHQEQSAKYPDIKFVFLITFRQLNLLDEAKLSLPELLNFPSTLNETTTLDDQMMEYIIEHQDQILLVLDGYDEYKGRHKITSDFHSAFPDSAKIKLPIPALISKLVRKSILRNSVILMTSRSSQAVEIAESVHFDRYVEITGFSKPCFNEYVDKYFEFKPDDVRNKAVKKVKASQHYMSFGVVPLLCYLMCVVVEWEITNNLLGDSLGVQTLTQFYCQVVNCVEMNYNRAISSLGKDAAKAAVTKTLDIFSRLCAQLIKQDRFSFTEEDLTNLSITDEELVYLKSSSLLSCTPVASNSPFGETIYEYSFHHYSFEEFLACRYFVSINKLPSKVTDISYVFMSGLMDPQRNASLMEELLQRLEKELSPFDRRLILLPRCLEEYKDKTFVMRVLIARNRYEWGGFKFLKITDMDCSCVAMLVNTFTAASRELTPPPHQLHMYSSSLTSSGLEVLMPSLTVNSCIITELALWNCELDEECARTIGSSLEHSNITSLKLRDNNIGDIGAACIAEQSSKLTVLDLGNNNITERGAAHIAKHGNNLTDLCLDSNNISDSGASCIAKHCSNLTNLNLSWNKITDSGIYCIAKQCSNLTNLGLSRNEITDSGAICIAKHCGNLIKLNLSRNQIADSGATCIAKHCSRLSQLDLWGNNITDTGVDYIVKHCGSLYRLNLSRNPVSGECKAKTRQFCKKNNPGLSHLQI